MNLLPQFRRAGGAGGVAEWVGIRVPSGLEAHLPPKYYVRIPFSCSALLAAIPDESDVQGVWRAGGWIPFRSLYMRGLQGEFDVRINLNLIWLGCNGFICLV